MRAAMCITGALAPLAALAGCNAPAPGPVQPVTQATPSQQQLSIGPQLITYKSTPQRDLSLHVFQPDAAVFPGARPAILFFHGGGWVEGEPERFYDQARHLAGLGVVAVSAEYRIANRDGTDPAIALSDAISAMRYLRAHAGALAIDPARMAAGGGSAGGQLAAALASANGFDDPADDRSIARQPMALVLFNPVIDNGPDGYGYRQVAAYWQQFSPLHNIRPGHPPTLIMLGTADRLIPVATAERYCAAVRAVQSECRLELYEGQPHAFFGLQRSPFHYRKTLEAMDAFLRSVGFLPPDGP